MPEGKAQLRPLEGRVDIDRRERRPNELGWRARQRRDNLQAQRRPFGATYQRGRDPSLSSLKESITQPAIPLWDRPGPLPQPAPVRWQDRVLLVRAELPENLPTEDYSRHIIVPPRKLQEIRRLANRAYKAPPPRPTANLIRQAVLISQGVVSQYLKNIWASLRSIVKDDAQRNRKVAQQTEARAFLLFRRRAKA